jgi:hypothetical protein
MGKGGGVEKGNISNEVVPRLLIVFEGLIGLLPTPAALAKEAAYRKTHRWKRAVNCYEINEVMAKHIWDLTWRKNFSIDVVTFMGSDFAAELRNRLDDERLPLGTVRSSTPGLLSRELAYDPSVFAVYDPDPTHVFTYGGKGRVLDPYAPDFYGV